MKLLAAIGIAAVMTGCGSKEEPASAPQPSAPARQSREAGVFAVDRDAQLRAHVVTGPAHTRSIAAKLSTQGQLTPNEDRVWRVGAVAGGKVESLAASLGDNVRAGQVLGRIHSHDEHEARASYQQALVELSRAKAAQQYALQRRDRARRLLELRAGSRQDLENAEAELVNAEAGIEKAQALMTMERTHLVDILHVPLSEEGPPAAVADAHPDEGIPILAPASGAVYDRKATQGSVLNTGDEILSIADLSTLWMIAAVNETDAAGLWPGQTARIQVRAYGEREFAGRVLKLGEHLDPATRTLQVRIAVPNTQGLLKPEMYATAIFDRGSRREALFLPEEAVQEVNGVSAVFVRRSPTEFESRAVKTGQRAQGEVEILEGLKPTDEVVTRGSFILKSELLKSTIEEN